MSNKERLIQDIQNLLNSYDGVSKTFINPDLLSFMDEESLKSIIGSLLDQKDLSVAVDTTWLDKFKSNKES